MSRIERSVWSRALVLLVPIACGESGNAGAPSAPSVAPHPYDASAELSDLRLSSADPGETSVRTAESGDPALPDTGDAGAGQPDAASAVVVGDCRGVSPSGQCATEGRIDRCVVPTGQGVRTLVTEYCGDTEVCRVEGGQAQCVQDDGLCVPGAQRCASDTELQVCEGSGSWQTSECGGQCRPSPLGAFCAATGTTVYSATIEYELRQPNTDFDDWQEVPERRPAVGLLVVSTRGQELVDATTTDESGTFSVDVPVDSELPTTLALVLLRPSEDGTSAAFAVMQPRVPDGESSYLEPARRGGHQWLWEIDPGLSPSGSTLVISEALGGGAVHLFQQVERAYELSAQQYGKPGRSLAAWFRPNSSWTCGTCFFSQPAAVGSLRFDSQILFAATAENANYWADSVTAHEMGHWVMWSYGVRPNEGGPHCLGVSTFPGQAWSEGWATGFSSVLRGDARYWDKQYGTFFWLDLETRSYPPSLSWQRADPAADLHQLMDENEVAAMIWGLASFPGTDQNALFSALSSPSMTQAPFGRGYTRHSWTLGDGCVQQEVEDLGVSAPTFADYLDALRCEGVPSDALDAVVEPELYYPYLSGEVSCP